MHYLPWKEESGHSIGHRVGSRDLGPSEGLSRRICDTSAVKVAEARVQWFWEGQPLCLPPSVSKAWRARPCAARPRVPCEVCW